MKLLLTSGGVTNPTIHDALVRLLGKPTSQAAALCVPTAQWGHPLCGPASARGFVTGLAPWGGLTSIEWASLGLLELTAMPTIGADRWRPWVEDADVLLVDGGDATYLAHHLRTSGLAELLPSLTEKVWVGVSAGSMVLTPRIGADFVEWAGAPDDRTLGVVDFAIFPHLEVFPDNSLAAAQRWAAHIGGPSYALDDQSAITVVGDDVHAVSEGTWHFFPGPSSASVDLSGPASDMVEAVSELAARDQPTLTDGTVTLRPWRDDDVPRVVAGHDAEIDHWFGNAAAPTEAGQRSVVGRWRAAWAAGEQLASFVINVAGEPVGVVEIRRLDKHGAELSWWLYEGHRGRGYAARGVRVVSDWALTAADQGGWGRSRVQARVEPGNVHSMRVATRSGLRREGTQRVAPGTGDRAETTEYAVFARLNTDR